MNILIGDIGNTNTKICLIELKTLRIKQLISFSSNKIYSRKFLIKTLKKILKKKLSAKMHYFQV